MDDFTRRRLARDHETLRDAANVELDMNVSTRVLNAELEKLGLPSSADVGPASVLLGLPGGMMMARGMPLDQMKLLLEIAFMYAPSEPYDIDSCDADIVPTMIEEFIRDHTPADDDDKYRVPLWVRMFRNSYAEMIFAVEDSVDVDKTEVEIMDISKNVCTFLLETYYIATNPQSAC